MTTQERRDRRRRLGRRIAAARALHGWSQDDLATKVGLDRTAVSRAEAGKRAVAVDELEQIAGVLDLPLGWFLADLPTASGDSARGLSLNELAEAYLGTPIRGTDDRAERIPA